MFRSRKTVVLLSLLLVLMLAAAVPAAWAAGGTTHTVTTSPESFTIAAGQCPNLPAGVSVSGSGERVSVNDTTINADGSSRTILADTVQGTATDNNGKKYTFFYGNTFIIDTSAAGASKGKMYDLFLLQDSAGHAANRYVLRNGFIWTWSWTGPDPFAVWPPANFKQLVSFGDTVDPATISPHCDPL